MSLKPLANKILERNSNCNSSATNHQKQRNFEDKKGGSKVALKKAVADLSLEEFKARNIAVRIQSEVLGENLWLVSNEETREHLKAEGLVCYLADEIQNLRGLSKKMLRKIHEVKKVFEKSQVIQSGGGLNGL